MIVRILAFTDKGMELACRLADALKKQFSLDNASAADLTIASATAGGIIVTADRCSQPASLSEWTQSAFAQADALIYVGAVGIAVRAIAPFLQDKAHDPAVVVTDELGHYAIPILSGHLGGANDLARAVGREIGAVPVLTTATDINGVFAVDEWARHHNCAVREPELIRQVSSKLLNGETVVCRSDFPVQGDVPDKICFHFKDDKNTVIQNDEEETPDFTVSVYQPEDQEPDILHLIPRIGVLGVGCRKGISRQQLESAYEQLLSEESISPEAVARVCSIDLKASEPGLNDFCADHGFPLLTCPAGTLNHIQGKFTSSDFVRDTVGTDNVCERSCVWGAGEGGRLIVRKRSGGGVTMALALQPFFPDWRWTYG